MTLSIRCNLEGGEPRSRVRFAENAAKRYAAILLVGIVLSIAGVRELIGYRALCSVVTRKRYPCSG